MGSRFVLPLLLFAIAAVAGGFYWMSRSEGGRGLAEAPGATTRPTVEPQSARLDRPQAGSLEDDASEPQRKALAQRPDGGESAAARAASRQTGLRGRVVDRQGTGVPEARVFASGSLSGLPLDWELGADSQAVQESVSDSEGWFELDGMAAGSARFLVRAAGYAPLEQNDVAIPAGDSVELPAFVIRQGALLSGRVLDASGRGVGGAELMVQVERPGFFIAGGLQRPAAVSEADGSFRIDELACGKWEVRVISEDHPARSFEGLAERPGEEVHGLEFRLPAGASIAGVVIDVPVEERGELFVLARQARSGDFGTFSAYLDARKADVTEEGSFVVRGLVPGETYVLEARSRDREQSAFLFGGRSRSDLVKARAGETGIELRYKPASTVTFRVIDARTREPITDYTISYGRDFLQPHRGDDGKVLRSHPEGYARLDRLRLGSEDERLKLEIRSTGYETFRRDDLALVRGDVIDLGRIFLDPVPTLTVLVVDRQTRAPIAGARVSLEEERSPANGMTVEHRVSIGVEDDDEGGIQLGDVAPTSKTDADGVAVLTSLQGETRTLRVTADGYAAFESPGLFLPVGKDLEQNVSLGLGGSVLVSVLTADGDPKAGARIEHRNPGELSGGAFSFGPTRSVTDTEGVYEFENLEPGVHAFRIQEGDGAGAFFAGEAMVQVAGMESGDDDSWSEIEVVEGARGELVLVEAPRGSLSGRVNEAGLPLAGATLSLLDEKQQDDPMAGMMFPGMGGGSTARTDGRGEYVFEDVKEGRYLLKVEHPTRHMKDELSVVVRPGPNRFDVELPVAVLEGRITSQDGKPLAGLKVSAEKLQEGPSARRFMMIMESDGGDTIVSGGEELNAETVYTDEDGRYTLRGVTPDVDLIVKAEGRDVQDGKSEAVQLDPGEVKRGVDFACEPAGSIEVQVLLADGSPARFCMVRASYADASAGVEPEFAFVETGSSVLSGLRPGKWLVNVNKEGPGPGGRGGGIDREIDVVADERAVETFHLD